MISTSWLRRRLDKIEKARSGRNQDREKEVSPPRFSVVIDERVRLEFSA
jgi:hypothetical protein